MHGNSNIYIKKVNILCRKVIQKNQLDATMIYWSIRSAQHVSGNFCPSSGAWDWDSYSIWYSVLLLWLAEVRRAATWHYVPRFLTTRDVESWLPFNYIYINIWIFFARFTLLCNFNHLTPNGNYMGRTAQLTSRCCILYIYSTNIRTEYFKHAA